MQSNAHLEKLDLLLQNRAYDPNREPPPDQIVMRIEHKNIGSLQNLVTITGFQKNGKGKYIAGILAAALSRQTVFDISVKLPPGKNKIALWDTEQGDYDFFKSMDNIKNLAGLQSMPANFNAFNVREDEPLQALRMIDRYLALNPDTGILCLDGLTDLVLSYNDETESKRLVNILKKWSKLYNLLIIGVLHKGKSTSATIGHLGAMADRAAQSVLSVEKIKERGTFQLKPDYLRSADDFTPIEIFYNNSAHEWQQTAYIPEETDEKVKRIKLRPAEYDASVHSTNIVRIFSVDTLIPYKELVQAIKEIYATGEQWAKECIPHLMKEQLIFKTEHGYTNNRKARLFVNQ